jgi:spore germination cell wall hydrolase CwlJ-like protein
MATTRTLSDAEIFADHDTPAMRRVREEAMAREAAKRKVGLTPLPSGAKSPYRSATNVVIAPPQAPSSGASQPLETKGAPKKTSSDTEPTDPKERINALIKSGTLVELSPSGSQASGGDAGPAKSSGGNPTKLSDADLDYLVRTTYGEAAGEGAMGHKAVAAVIMNRARQSGMSVKDVVLAKSQFEPWGNQGARARMESLDPSSPKYQSILNNVRGIVDGTESDPTNGATHFYAPKAQAALGRSNPSWDNGNGVDIGNHRFFNLGYKGGGGTSQNPHGIAGGGGGSEPVANRPATVGSTQTQVASNDTGTKYDSSPLTPQEMREINSNAGTNGSQTPGPGALSPKNAVGPGALFGGDENGYGIGDALMGAGASLMAISNPEGGRALTSAMIASSKKDRKGPEDWNKTFVQDGQAVTVDTRTGQVVSQQRFANPTPETKQFVQDGQVVTVDKEGKNVSTTRFAQPTPDTKQFFNKDTGEIVTLDKEGNLLKKVQVATQDQSNNRQFFNKDTGEIVTVGPDGKLVNTVQATPKPEQPAKPLPAAAVGIIQKNQDAAEAAARVADDTNRYRDMIVNGKLDMSVASRLGSNFRTLLNDSDEKTRNTAQFMAYLEDLRNQKLLENKGVQTEGDAVRAMNSIMPGVSGYDNPTVLSILDRSSEALRKAYGHHTSKLGSVLGIYKDYDPNGLVQGEYGERAKRLESFEQDYSPRRDEYMRKLNPQPMPGVSTQAPAAQAPQAAPTAPAPTGPSAFDAVRESWRRRMATQPSAPAQQPGPAQPGAPLMPFPQGGLF